MPSLDDHFRALTRTRPRGEWPPLRSLRATDVRRIPRASPPRLQRHRVIAGAVGVVVAAAGIGLAVRGFGLLEAPPPRPAAVVENGTIAFVGETASDLSLGGGQTGIFAVNPDGSGRIEVADDPGALESDPAWSRDGTRIAFSSSGDEEGDPPGLYVADSDGSGVTLLLEDATGATLPSWFPGGQRIVFESGLGHELSGTGDRDIYAIDVGTREVTRLTADAARDEYPAVSPDGTTIAFTRQQHGVLDIFVMNADGTGVTRLSSGPRADLRPSWSPDGAMIAFERRADICVMNADGTGVRKLTEGPAQDGRPAWSPDGRKIAFERDGDIYVMDADGTSVTRLTQGPRIESSPAWQPVPARGEVPG